MSQLGLYPFAPDRRWVPPPLSGRVTAWLVARIPRTPLGTRLINWLSGDRWRYICIEELGVTFIIGKLDRFTGYCVREIECDAWYDDRWRASALRQARSPARSA